MKYCFLFFFFFFFFVFTIHLPDSIVFGQKTRIQLNYNNGCIYFFIVYLDFRVSKRYKHGPGSQDCSWTQGVPWCINLGISNQHLEMHKLPEFKSLKNARNVMKIIIKIYTLIRTKKLVVVINACLWE